MGPDVAERVDWVEAFAVGFAMRSKSETRAAPGLLGLVIEPVSPTLR